jgi:exopolysaccharide production protein ExoF
MKLAGSKRMAVKLTVAGAAVAALVVALGKDNAIEAKAPPEPADLMREIDATLARRAVQVAKSDLIAKSNEPSRPVEVRPSFERVQSASGRQAGAGRFELTGADKLSIKFHGNLELSGIYRVNPDESVSIPAIGRLSITGLSGDEFEALLVERAAKITGRETFITVEVAEYRPVFVSGLVARPGSHAWHPGMTVLHAVTLLGGIYRATSENSGGVVIGADGEILRLRRATNDLKRSMAVLARLRAERMDRATIPVPDELVALVGRQDATGLIAEQMSVLASSRASTSSKLESLERARQIANEELKGLKEQGKRLRDMLATRRDFKEKMDGLQARGIVRADRVMDEQSRLVDLEDRSTTVSVGIARVQGTLAQIERELIGLRQERTANIDMEIFKLNKENAQLELDIEAARLAYFKITGTQAPATFGPSDGPKTQVIEYQIVRYEGGMQNSYRADQFARLKPGDILVVDVQKDRAAP